MIFGIMIGVAACAGGSSGDDFPARTGTLPGPVISSGTSGDSVLDSDDDTEAEDEYDFDSIELELEIAAFLSQYPSVLSFGELRPDGSFMYIWNTGRYGPIPEGYIPQVYYSYNDRVWTFYDHDGDEIDAEKIFIEEREREFAVAVDFNLIFLDNSEIPYVLIIYNFVGFDLTYTYLYSPIDGIYSRVDFKDEESYIRGFIYAQFYRGADGYYVTQFGEGDATLHKLIISSYGSVKVDTILDWTDHEEVDKLTDSMEPIIPNEDMKQRIAELILERELRPFGGFEQISFGGYDWLILDEDDDKMLLLSTYILEHRVYHDELVPITWAESDVRKYLNGEFYDSFTASDRARIIETRVVNDDHPWEFPWHSQSPLPLGGDDTDDHIFLLSLDEVLHYFGDSGQILNPILYPAGIFDNFRFIRRAMHLPGGTYIFEDYAGEGYFDNEDEIEPGDYWYWWLRSLGSDAMMPSFIDTDGDIIFYNDGLGAIMSNFNGGGIRPAMWVKKS